MMMKSLGLKIAVASSLLFVSLSAWGWTEQQVIDQLKQVSTTSATYTQVQHMQNNTVTFDSEGHMKAVAGQSLEWVQTEPFTQVLKFSNDKLFMQVEDDTPVEVTAKSNPKAFSFVAVMRAVLASDVKTLKEYFNVQVSDVQKDGQTYWKLHMTPRLGIFMGLFQYVNMVGLKQVDSIEIVDKAGNQTLIDFQYK